MLKLYILSDIHLETRGYIPERIFPTNIPHKSFMKTVMILAGDIGDPYTKIYKKFAKDTTICVTLHRSGRTIKGIHVSNQNERMCLKAMPSQ